ncbi:Exostosin family protein [Striga hermonthica]|uniref:Exostosin family protein n=1 Tax=Striga hermonthica TaxID=68872 RepID=A0A9N7NM40_STRHE|nr:Exostosin family protein [Striga hermonthica]
MKVSALISAPDAITRENRDRLTMAPKNRRTKTPKQPDSHNIRPALTPGRNWTPFYLVVASAAIFIAWCWWYALRDKGAVEFPDYTEIKNLKIFIYPDPDIATFTSKIAGNCILPDYIIKNLRGSAFSTLDPDEADFFLVPFLFHSVRQKRSDADVESTLTKYVRQISLSYPYWDRFHGADHIIVPCSSGDMITTGRVPMLEKTIRVVCSVNRWSNFSKTEDISAPCALPDFLAPYRENNLKKRTTLAYWEGLVNSKTRKVLVQRWSGVQDLDITKARILARERGPKMRKAKFCLCVAGSPNPNACITTAILNGCVPAIVEDGIVLPFHNILDWSKFAVIVKERDIYQLKKILEEKAAAYTMLHANLTKVQTHFFMDWGKSTEYDGFRMILYQIWLLRPSGARS